MLRAQIDYARKHNPDALQEALNAFYEEVIYERIANHDQEFIKQTLLHVAVRIVSQECVKILLHEKVDPDKSSEVWHRRSYWNYADKTWLAYGSTARELALKQDLTIPRRKMIAARLLAAPKVEQEL